MEKDLLKYNPRSSRHKNLASEQCESLKKLKNDSDIIKPADIGSASYHGLR